MSLLETNGDYQFAANVERLSTNVSKLLETFEEQMEVNRKLMNSVKQLTEVIDHQTEQNKKLIKRFEKEQEKVTEKLRPDLVLM